MRTQLRLIPAIILVFAIFNSHAQCVYTLNNGGKGCMGDTLKINVKHATGIRWKHNGHVVKYVPGPSKYGVTVAGDKNSKAGTDSTKLSGVNAVKVDAAGNIYVSDANNNRVQKWAPGARYGVTVAGDKSGKAGKDSAHLYGPASIFIDGTGNIYIADYGNNRVQKWAPGAKYGITVAGQKNGTSGSDSTFLNQPDGLWVDGAGNVFVSDQNNNRLQKWAPGAKHGVRIAGPKDGVFYPDTARLNSPHGLALDASGNIYVCDYYHSRIRRFVQGAIYGVTVAGHQDGSYGYDVSRLFYPNSLWLDKNKNIYIADSRNNRVQKWAPGAKYGTTIAGDITGRPLSDSFACNPIDICMDTSGNLYIADNNRVQKWYLNSYLKGTYTYIADSAGDYSVTIDDSSSCHATSNHVSINRPNAATFINAGIAAGQSYSFNGASYTAGGTYIAHDLNKAGCDSTVTLNLTVNTLTFSHNGAGCVGDTFKVTVSGANYINWMRNGKIIKTTMGNTYASYGKKVAGTGFYGYGAGGLNDPTGVTVDASGNVYIADRGNQRIQKWAPGADTGITVAGHRGVFRSNYYDTAYLANPSSLVLDSANNMYILDYMVLRWAQGASTGTIVAGRPVTNLFSSQDSGHFNNPTAIFLDAFGNLYITDYQNNRVQKWPKGWKYGITIAGSKGCVAGRDSAHLNNPYASCVDAYGNLYVTDSKNNRVQKWAPGAKYGVTVAGSKNGVAGSDSIHLNSPAGIAVDGFGYLFIADAGNNRVQRYAPGASYGVTVAGAKNGTAGTDSLHLNSPAGIYLDTKGNMYIVDENNSRVQKWAVKSNFTGTAIYVADSAGTYSASVLYNNGYILNSGSYTAKLKSTTIINTCVTSGHSYTFNGKAYTTAGTYTAHLTNKAGCDSTVTLNLTLSKIYTSLNAAICKGSTYTFNGSSYSTTGAYTVHKTTASGCDSAITLNLKVNNTSASALSTCIISGTTYRLNGKAYNSAGVYYDTVLNKAGCDSVITLTLSTNSAPMVHTGYGCVGDTIKITVSGVSEMELKRNGRIICNFPRTYGTTVAGYKNGYKNVSTDSTAIMDADGVYVDGSANVYVADEYNHRVQKWASGAKYGITVAGNKKAVAGYDSTLLFTPLDVKVDSKGNVYVPDRQTQRVVKWAPGAKYGVTVAGQYSAYSNTGTDSIHLSYPLGIFIDNSGNVYVADNGNNRVQKWAVGAKYGTTVAGQKNCQRGTDSAHLTAPAGIYVDASGNIYVTDAGNNRVQKWAPGAKYGVTVAGDKKGTYGSDSAHLNGPIGLCLDKNKNIYITDRSNNRVMKWAPGATYGKIVAGDASCMSGNDSFHLSGPFGVYVDANNYIYVGDGYNGRVQRWKEDTSILNGTYTYIIDSPGVYTAYVKYKGGCAATGSSLVITGPHSTVNAYICTGQSYTFNGKTYSTAGRYTAHVTAKSNCDSIITLNLTVHSATTGTQTIALFKGQSYTIGKKAYTYGLYTDTLTNSQGCDSIRTTIINFHNFSTGYSGDISHTGKGCGGDRLSITVPWNCTVQWFRGKQFLRAEVVPKPYGVTVAGQKDGIYGIDSAHLFYPSGIFVDKANNVYVSDEGERVTKWAPGAGYGVTVAGQKDFLASSDSAHMFSPDGIWVDTAGSIYASEVGNNRVSKWTKGARYGTTIAGDKNGVVGTDSAHFQFPRGIFLDAANNLYVADAYNNRIQKWANGAKYGTTVAGDKNGKYGSDSAHLGYPHDVFVDKSNNIYVADMNNNRIQEWNSYIKYGITVAGHKNGSWTGRDSTMLGAPTAVWVDNGGEIYAADNASSCVMERYTWLNYGIPVAGDYYVYSPWGYGSDSLHMNIISSIFVDTVGNVYVGDNNNHRVQKWNRDYTSYINSDSAGLYTAVVTFPDGSVATTNPYRVSNMNTTGKIAATICTGASYTLLGAVYSATGTYTAHTTNSSGCDSVIILNLSVKKGPLKSNSMAATICTGQSYLFNNKLRYVQGMYSDTFKTTAGCDSINTLSLSVLTATLSHGGKGCQGDTLWLNAPGATKVNWKRNNRIIDTAFTPYITIDSAGSYTAAVTFSTGCTILTDSISAGLCKYKLVLTLKADTGKSILAVWNKQRNGPYKLYYGLTTIPGVFTTVQVTDTQYIIPNTKPGLTYIAYVVDTAITGMPKMQSNYAYYSTPGGTCSTTAPASLTVKASISSASVGWSGTCTGYQVFYKVLGATVWSTTYTTATSYTFYTLRPSTCYLVFITNKCSSGYGYSTAIDTFCTAASCIAPSTVTLSAASCHGFTAKWTAVTGVSSYQVYITRTTGVGSPSTANYSSSTNSYTTKGLLSHSQYSVYVKSRCNSSSLSTSSSSVSSISTLSVGCKDDGAVDNEIDNGTQANTINVYPNPNNGGFTLDMRTPNTTDAAHVQILNMLGQPVAERLVDNDNGWVHAALDYHNLAAGVYLVKVVIGAETQTAHIVIQN